MTPQEMRRLLANMEIATTEDGTLRDLFLARLDAWPTDSSTADRLLDDLDRLLGGVWFSNPETPQKVFDALTGLADSVSQLDGMTVNERLAAFGLFELWDASSAECQIAIRRKLRAVLPAVALGRARRSPRSLSHPPLKRQYRHVRMTKSHRIVAVVVGAVLSIPGVFVASGLYFDSMVRSEYASGARTSTDGDSIMIPMMGVTMAWTLLLLVVGGIAGIILIVRRARRGAA